MTIKPVTILTLVALVLRCHSASAQWAVEDAANLVQNSLTALNAAASYVRQGEKIINEYNVIRNQIVQIGHEVTNLQRIPKGLNFLDDNTLVGSRLNGLLGQANGVSFELDQATKDFDKLYRQ